MKGDLHLRDLIALDQLSEVGAFPISAFSLLGQGLKDWLQELLTRLGVSSSPVIEGQCHPQAYVQGPVYIAPGAVVEPTAYIKGPAYIGANSEVRHGAYIRGTVYVGQNCVVGHTTEVKGSCFFDGAKAGHFAYVGDSLLGRDVNLGAGTKLANLRLDGKTIKYQDPQTGKLIDSGLRKFGAILGDRAQTGCNAVLSPGTVLLPKTGVYPCVHFKGTLGSGWAR